MQEKKPSETSGNPAQKQVSNVTRPWELPRTTPDYAGGRGFKVPQPAQALEAAREIPHFTPPQKKESPLERADVNPVLQPLRTYKNDIASTLTSNQSSLVSIALAEQNKRAPFTDGKKRLEAKRAGKRAVIFRWSFLFFVLGALSLGGIYIVIQNYNHDGGGLSIQPTVAVDKVVTIDVTALKPSDLALPIHEAVRDRPIPANNIAHVVFTETIPAIGEMSAQVRVLSTNQLFDLIGAMPPQSLRRSLEQTFTFGVYQTDRPNTFLILETTFFESTFSEMFTWEQRLAADLGPLLGIDMSTLPEAQSFTDKIVENRDTRTLYDNNGAPILFYSFFDQKTLFIATNPEIMTEVFLRLNSNQVIN
jgi:hypothetical protein